MVERAVKVQKMPEEITVSESSGNVFAHLGIAEPAETLAKDELARRISRILRQRYLTQQQAANLAERPGVSHLLHIAFSTGLWGS